MATIKEMIESIRKTSLNVTVIGDSVLDLWHFGDLVRPNPEVPGASLNAHWWSATPPAIFEEIWSETPHGGAANVLRSFIPLCPNAIITYHTTIPAAMSYKERWAHHLTGKIYFRADADITGPSLSLPSAIADYVIIADYGKGLFTWDIIGEIFQKAKNVIFSPHISTCRTFSPKHESLLAQGIWVMNDAERMELRLKDADPARLIVTHGEGPVSHEGQIFGYKEFSHEPVQNIAHTCGMGDVFLAAFSAAVFSKHSVDDCIRFAIWCCKRVLTSGRKGTHYLDEKDLKDADTSL